MNNGNQESGSTAPEAVETEEEQDMLQEQDPDLVLLEQGKTVEICNGELIAEIQEPYSGVFWEDEEHEEVADVYYVKFTNCTDFMIKSADITLGDDEGELLFHIDMLKAGETAFVAEADKQKAKSEHIRYIDSDIKYIEEERIITDLIKVDLANENELKVTNLTGDFLPLLHIYYSPFNEKNIRISGTASSIPMDGIEANQEITVAIDTWNNIFRVIDVISIAE
jgi:hypothetical protein